MTTIVLIEGEPASSCCNASISVLRNVHDTVSYRADAYEHDVLHITYAKVYAGDADGYIVTCDGCDKVIDVEIEED